MKTRNNKAIGERASSSDLAPLLRLSLHKLRGNGKFPSLYNTWLLPAAKLREVIFLPLHLLKLLPRVTHIYI